jgi:hypothetical protein
MDSSNNIYEISSSTMLMMGDGVTYKKIGDMTSDDKVMSINPFMTINSFEPTDIIIKSVGMSNKLFTIVDSFDNTINLTDNQLVMIEINSRYILKPVEKLSKGDISYIFCKQEKKIVLSVIKDIYQTDNELVYQFECNKQLFITSSFIVSNKI